MNLSAFCPSLVESEIFGHKKGAFTGAFNDKRGALLEAREGTLFLDEIDSLPKSVQTKLLLFLDHKRVRPVGSSLEYPAPTRLIFAAGRSCSALVESGEFRADFYFRLQTGVILKLQSLREQPERVVELCQQFCSENQVTITKTLVDLYCRYPWPGNVRQLMSHLTKKTQLSAGKKLIFDRFDEDLLKHQSLERVLPESDGLLPMKKLKKIYIEMAYQRMSGNIGATAKALGLSQNTIRTSLFKSTQPASASLR